MASVHESGGHAVAVAATDGAPTDADLDGLPQGEVEGATNLFNVVHLVYDDTNDALYVRKLDGTYVSVALT